MYKEQELSENHRAKREQTYIYIYILIYIPIYIHVYIISEMYKAHELSETHRAKGKIVVKIRGATKYSQFTCFILGEKY